MFKVQTFNNIAKSGLDLFPQKFYKISSAVLDPDAILLRSHVLNEVSIPKSVKVIGRAGAGVNNIPVAAMTEMGIPVICTPGANANAVSELVIASMLLVSRNLCMAWDYTRQLNGSDAELSAAIERHKKQFIGKELYGKTLGIIGLGSIGVRVANAAIHLGMRVIGYDPTISVTRAWELSSEVIQARNIEELLLQSDYVTLHVPLVDATRHLISNDYLKLMKPSAFLVNFAREAIVDNNAILAALNETKLAGYVCDFPCESLLHHPAVISFPHLGASTHEAEENCAVMLVNQVRNFIEYGAITNSVNFPEMDVPKCCNGQRIAVVNDNIPNMVAQISSALAEAGLNILSLVNKSRDKIAYTLLDVSGNATDELLWNIAGISGVRGVRKLPDITR